MNTLMAKYPRSARYLYFWVLVEIMVLGVRGGHL